MQGIFKKLSPLFCLLILSPNLSAETGLYIGGAGGVSDIRHSDFDDDSGYRGYVGWMFNKGIGLELAYGTLGEFSVEDGNSKIEIDAVTEIALVFGGAFLKNLSTEMIVKIGAYQLDITPTILNGTAEESDETGLTVSYGIAQPIGENFAVTLNWQNYWNIEDVEVSTYTLGMRFNF